MRSYSNLNYKSEAALTHGIFFPNTHFLAFLLLFVRTASLHGVWLTYTFYSIYVHLDGRRQRLQYTSHQIRVSEKEAQLYLHLLKYGPKPSALLAKSLKTCREDVYRTITSLIDMGMVNPSLNSQTVCAAVETSILLSRTHYPLPSK